MITPCDIERMHEEFGLLNGTRGSDQGRKAVRMAEMQPLLEFPASPESALCVGAAPTKAEFDALVHDVHAIFKQMGALSEALRLRLAR